MDIEILLIVFFFFVVPILGFIYAYYLWCRAAATGELHDSLVDAVIQIGKI
jgi:hypothetical protein